MKTQSRPRLLPPDAVRQRLTKLTDFLSKGDFERLEKILPLFENDQNSEASLVECLERLFSGSTPQNRLADFRAFRFRLKDVAAKAGTGLELAVDSKKRSPARDRRCWFALPPDPAAEHIADWADRETTIDDDDVTDIHSHAAFSGELTVRFVITYDENDQCLADDLLSRLKRHVGASVPCEDTIWDAKVVSSVQELLEVLEESVEKSAGFGLLMSPPGDSLDDETLRQWEEGGGKPVIRVDFRGTAKSFERCSNEHEKDRFALDIICNIRKHLEKHRSEMEERGAQCLTDAADAPSDPRYLVDAKAQETSLEGTEALLQRGRPVVAIEALQEWIEDEDGPPFCALLGEYGIGKTTALKQFAQSLLSQRREGKEVPLPIFIDLRLYSEAIHKGNIPKLEELLQELLDRVWKTPRIKFTAQDILRLVREEGAVLIFDGLDEKLVHLDEAQGQAFLRTLWGALPLSRDRLADKAQDIPLDRPGRLVLSCRSHYFKTLSAQNAMLRGEGRDGVRSTHYRAWYLLPFDDGQIREYLAQVLENDRPDATPSVDATLRQFKSIHNLSELATRPYLLSLITHPDLIGRLDQLRERDGVAGTVTVYDFLVDRWLSRDSGKHQLREEDKLQLMEDIAADMWREGAREWPWPRVVDWFSRRLYQKPEWRARYLFHGSQEILEEDFRTATFVLRPDNSRDRFRFAHSSFQEYFLARYLHRALVEGKQQNWEMDVSSPETLDFLGQLIATAPETQDKVLRAVEAILSQAPTRATGIAFQYWLQAIKHGLPEPKPQKVNLRKVNLSGLIIRGRSKDQPLNLFAADLSDADLTGSQFENVNLSHANLSGARAERAEFHHVAARDINLAEADLTASVWRQSDISDLRGGVTATWYDTQLIACDLDPDDLPEDFGCAGTLSDPRDLTRSIPSQKALTVSQVTTAFGHVDSVNTCAITPDGRHLVSGSYDRTLNIWNLQSGTCLRTLEGHTDSIRTCAITPDGRHLVSGSSDNTLKIWNLGSGACLRNLKGHAGSVLACAITPDGRHLVSGSDDNTLKIWNLGSGACLRTLEGHADSILACAIIPDGRHLVSGSDDNTLKIWDLSSGICLRTLEGHADSILACAITPDGHRLVSGAKDRTLKIWDLNSDTCLCTLKGHASWIEACAIAPDGRHLVSGSRDKTLKIWDLESGTCLRTLEGHTNMVGACAITPDSHHLVSGSDDNVLKIWDLESGVCLRTLEGHADYILACAIAPDSRHLVSASRKRTLKVWDLESGVCLRTLEGQSLVLACAITPDGRHLVSESEDSTLKVWDLESGACLRTLEGNTHFVKVCAITPDGCYLVTGSMYRTLKIWDLESGACLHTLKGHMGPVLAGAVTPDSRHLVSGSSDKTLKVWNLESGAYLRTLEGHTGPVLACAVTPDGRHLVSGSEDNTLKIWDLESGACPRTLEGHTGPVLACAVTPDGRHLVSGSEDNTLKIWDLGSGACLRTLEEHAGSVLACAITPDGRHLVSGSRDRTLKLWALSLDSDPPQIAPVMTLINGPTGETAALDYPANHILSASSEAWRFLGWRYFDQEAGRLRILPAEHAGPLPTK